MNCRLCGDGEISDIILGVCNRCGKKFRDIYLKSYCDFCKSRTLQLEEAEGYKICKICAKKIEEMMSMREMR